MVLPSQLLFIKIMEIEGVFARCDGCDGFPMTDLNMEEVDSIFINIMQTQQKPQKEGLGCRLLAGTMALKAIDASLITLVVVSLWIVTLKTIYLSIS